MVEFELKNIDKPNVKIYYLRARASKTLVLNVSNLCEMVQLKVSSCQVSG
jgi:hypothetical protein